jgi:hypothetical protein
VDEPVAVAGDLGALDADRAVHDLLHRGAREAVLADDLTHPLDLLGVLAPLPLEGLPHLPLGLGVDEVDPDGLGLQEAVDPVNGLDQVGELEADADEDRPVAVALEVAAGPGDDRLRGQDPELAVGTR